MKDDGIVFQMGEEEGDDGDDDHGGGDGAKGGCKTAPDPFDPKAHEGSYVYGYHAGSDLTDCIVIHELFFGGPFFVFHDFTLKDGEDRIAAAKGDGAAFRKGEK